MNQFAESNRFSFRDDPSGTVPINGSSSSSFSIVLLLVFFWRSHKHFQYCIATHRHHHNVLFCRNFYWPLLIYFLGWRLCHTHIFFLWPFSTQRCLVVVIINYCAWRYFSFFFSFFIASFLFHPSPQYVCVPGVCTNTALFCSVTWRGFRPFYWHLSQARNNNKYY